MRRSDLSSTATVYALVSTLLLAFALRFASLDRNQFLEDEALYAYWGLQIATGADAMLDNEPVDKPPLHPYSLAASFWLLGRPLPAEAPTEVVESGARLPSLFASITGIALVYAIGERLYPRTSTGLLAAAFLAVSPFDILFATTAFTDPLMTVLSLASILAAVSAKWGTSGLLLGLAAATKQQGLFFLPLVLAVGVVHGRSAGRRRRPPERLSTSVHRANRTILTARGLWRQPALRFLGGLVLVLAAVLWWDASRHQRPGFVQQSLISYGSLGWVGDTDWVGRGLAWLRWVCYFWASPWSWGLLAFTLTAWLLVGSFRRNGNASLRHGFATPSALDMVLVLFITGFLLVHWLVGLQIWDRYLLALIPLVALILARAFTGLPVLVLRARRRRVCSLALGLLLAGTFISPALLASRSELPLGGDHGAYDGVEALAGYVRTEAPAGAVLYHSWLGSHYRFYLYGAPLRLHWYPDLDDLVHDAYVYRQEPRYIAFPSWRDSSPAENALAAASIRLVPEFEAVRRDGSPSFRLYSLVGP